MFHPIDYLEWIEGRRHKAIYDFGSSDLTKDYRDIVPERLRRVDDYNTNVSLESQIADAYGPSVAPENVLVTAGATQANFLAAATVLNEQNGENQNPTILTEHPSYKPLQASPGGLNATVSSFAREQTDYRIIPRTLAEAIKDSTQLVTITNRHNPSGQLTSPETIENIASHTRRNNAYLLVDEVYAPFNLKVKNGKKTAFGGTTAAGIPDVLVSNSLTKFFGYGSLRLGWLIGPAEFIENATSTWWHFPSVAEPSRKLAQCVFANLEEEIAHSRLRIRENFALLSEFVKSRTDIEGFVPSGSIMAFVFHESEMGGVVAKSALNSGVLVVPGRFFECPEGFRLALGQEPEIMKEGLDILGDVLDSI
jgi:aspartate/methionine/tyrosine aminotransferase